MPKPVAPETLPYRPCVGVMLINADGRVWLGRRSDAEQVEGPGLWWQMPQGGIDEGEDAEAAARRELYEETSVTSAEYLADTPDWLTYDLPRALVGIAWKGRYRGQKQRWFAYRFTGADSEINVLSPGGGKHDMEFDQWRWVDIDELPDLVVSFKREVYEQVVAAFRHLVK